KSHLAGDFEITGGFEVVSADIPPRGEGITIALNITTDNDYTKFAKLGRFWRPGEGNVFLVGHWSKAEPGSRVDLPVPTDARVGKLRLSRKGSILRFLVAEGTDGAFRQIHETDFGDEDLDIVRFAANTNDS